MEFFERIKYWFYKKWLIRVAKSSGPFIAMPFLEFIEFELDKIFQDGGMTAVKKAAEEWPEKFEKEFNIKLDQMVEKIIDTWEKWHELHPAK